MEKILITPRSLTSAPPLQLDRLRAAGFDLVFSTPGQIPDEAELMRLLPGCIGWLAGVEPVSPEVIAAADRLRVISRNGTGVDSLPLDALEARQIRIEKAQGANATGVAELALGLMLAACRHIPDTAAGLRAGGWPRLRGREIEGTTVGIVGMGAIGRKVATVLVAMGAEVLAHDPFLPPLGALEGRVTYLPLAALFDRASVVSLHCPMTAEGAPLLDADSLARLGRGTAGAVIVNTARAGLVDDVALLAALEEGTVACYATDVFPVEPPVDRALADHPKVIATTHIGGLTDGSVARATADAVANLLRALGHEDENEDRDGPA